ncbi:MAG: hypothetical protein ABIJ09_05805 [Pseudomonadota bacterium]
MRTRLLLCTALLTLLALACSEDSPEKAFRAFTLAVSKGEHARAWDLFSVDTRTRLDSMIRAQDPSAKGDQVHEVLFQRGLLRATREIVGIEVLTQSRGRAVLRVSDEEGEQQQVTMVLEDGAWKLLLELPENPA